MHERTAGNLGCEPVCGTRPVNRALHREQHSSSIRPLPYLLECLCPGWCPRCCLGHTSCCPGDPRSHGFLLIVHLEQAGPRQCHSPGCTMACRAILITQGQCIPFYQLHALKEPGGSTLPACVAQSSNSAN